jgi:hypothetical protein
MMTRPDAGWSGGKTSTSTVSGDGKTSYGGKTVQPARSGVQFAGGTSSFNKGTNAQAGVTYANKGSNPQQGVSFAGKGVTPQRGVSYVAQNSPRSVVSPKLSLSAYDNMPQTSLMGRPGMPSLINVDDRSVTSKSGPQTYGEIDSIRGAGPRVGNAQKLSAFLSRDPNSQMAFGSIGRAPKQFTASIGDDMARGVGAPSKPLRGVSTDGRELRTATGSYFAPQQQPNQQPRQATGSYFPESGPTAGMMALGKINSGLGKYRDGLVSAGMFNDQSADLGPNYNPNDGRQSGPEPMPDPTSAPPQRTSLISDDPNSLMSPNTVGRGIGGLLGGLVGGPIGGMLGSKIGGMATDKAREYGHPLYGYGRGENKIAAEYDDPSLIVGMGKGPFSSFANPQATTIPQQQEKPGVIPPWFNWQQWGSGPRPV